MSLKPHVLSPCVSHTCLSVFRRLDPRCLEQWEQYMMPIDLAEIEREIDAAASSGRDTSKVSMDTCRYSKICYDS